MAITRSPMRLTIGQCMTGIAALALAFASLPILAAIALTLLVTCLIVLWRNPLPNPAAGEPIGCVFCMFGFVGGAIFGAKFAGPPPAECGLSVIGYGFIALWCGVLGSLAVGILGHFFILTLPEQRPSSHDLLDTKQEKARAEIESIEQLLARAEADCDEELKLKLAEYKAKREHDLEL